MSKSCFKQQKRSAHSRSHGFGFMRISGINFEWEYLFRKWPKIKIFVLVEVVILTVNYRVSLESYFPYFSFGTIWLFKWSLVWSQQGSKNPTLEHAGNKISLQCSTHQPCPFLVSKTRTLTDLRSLKQPFSFELPKGQERERLEFLGSTI